MPVPSQTTFDTDRWDARLHLFRLRRAVGGLANDGDMLEGALPFSGEAGLVALFERMGAPLVVLPPDAPVPVAGASYALEEYEALREPLRAFPRYEAPGRTKLFGVSVYVAITGQQVTVSLSGAEGDPYVVTDRDGDDALVIERGLRSCGLLRD
jgi:hypothetical protein